MKNIKELKADKNGNVVVKMDLETYIRLRQLAEMEDRTLLATIRNIVNKEVFKKMQEDL